MSKPAVSIVRRALRGRTWVAWGVAACVALMTVTPVGSQSNPPGHDVGDVRWFGLFTTDAIAATEFYADLFGWQVHQMAPGRYLITHDDYLIGGITRIESPDNATWITGVVVDDLSASEAATRRLNGDVLVETREAAGLGSWAVVEDPDGAQIMLIEPERWMGGTDAPGHWVWSELWTTDPDESVQFYADVVGWEPGTVDNLGGAYSAFLSGGVARAGLVPVEAGAMEPAWAPYVGVRDLGATMERVTQLGGSVVFEPVADVYGGRVAVVSDPTGVGFLIFELDPSRQVSR